MSKLILTTVFTVLALLTISTSAMAQTDSENNYGSLYPRRAVRSMSDHVARCQGDLLTVIISETSTANFTASTNASKSDSNTINPVRIPILDKIPLLGGLLSPLTKGMSTGASSNTSGTGTTTQKGNFSAKLTVMVKEVLPNGNLVIEGTRWVKVNKNAQNFVLSGIVRPEDIRTDNSVLSESIANAEIKGDGKGEIADRQRKGILTRLLDWLF